MKKLSYVTPIIGKVKPDDVDGSTFSTSNLGMYDVEEFIAIVNPPEAAILAISSAREIPVVESGEFKVGWRMKATISVDHRISDGADIVPFRVSRPVHAKDGRVPGKSGQDVGVNFVGHA